MDIRGRSGESAVSPSWPSALRLRAAECGGRWGGKAGIGDGGEWAWAEWVKASGCKGRKRGGRKGPVGRERAREIGCHGGTVSWEHQWLKYGHAR